MKQAVIYKGFAPEEISGEDMEQINRYTRRSLEKEEVYVFPLVLCDNEVDRDGERFSIGALQKLRRLFLGKTGVFDHNAKGESQVARIFSAQVEQDALRHTADGEVYHYLTARAYMARCDKTRDLILEIDAGIKKEVSVGCAVDEVLCSVCGADARKSPCGHRPGGEYEGKRCHHVLSQPTDAYEWSFVAVPAQPAAGVTKAFTGGHADGCRSVEELKKALGQGGLTLTEQEAGALAKEWETLCRRAKAGDSYREELICEVLRRAAKSGSPVDRTALRGIAEKLGPDELRELAKSFATPGEGYGPGEVQTAGGRKSVDGADSGYLI